MEIQYYTQRELARLLGLSSVTVRRMLDNRELPEGVPLGKRIVWPRIVVLEWLQAQGFLSESEAA